MLNFTAVKLNWFNIMTTRIHLGPTMFCPKILSFKLDGHIGKYLEKAASKEKQQ